METYDTDVCIVGGGPAGMVCGLLLAQLGIKVLVIESHANFEREYRGEILMPRFIQAMKQVRLFDYILQQPHLKLDGFELYHKDHLVTDFGISEISKEIPFILWMPQTLLLNALYDKAKKSSSFHLWFSTRMTDLVHENGSVVGVLAVRDGASVRIRAKVTVGADGRTSLVRARGGFELSYKEHDFDIIWFTIPKPQGYDNKVRAFLSDNHNYLSLPKYPAHVQCGIIVESGAFSKYKSQGIGSLQKELLSAHPMLHPFARDLKDFSPFHVLAAQAERVKEWARDGLMLIGDAAHTCSPAGAIGVSVAVATAVVASDVIADALEAKDHSKERLLRVQELREKDVMEIQGIQSRAATIINARGIFRKWISFLILMLLAKTRIFSRIQRRLMVAKGPLPVKRWA